MIPKKPQTHKTADEFISQAAADGQLPAAAPAKDKTFLLRIPYELWDKARRLAGAEAIPLHDYIIQALADKVQRDRA